MAKYAANIAWVLLIDEVSFSPRDFFPSSQLLGSKNDRIRDVTW